MRSVISGGNVSPPQRRSRFIKGVPVLQLNPPLPFNTPKGEGFAHFLIDYGPESDLYWIVLVTETGEIWTFANKEVRASKNITLGRVAPTSPKSKETDLPDVSTSNISRPRTGPIERVACCGRDSDDRDLQSGDTIAMDASSTPARSVVD